MLLALLQQLSLAAATSVQHVPNCSLAAPGVVDGVQTACACQSKDGKDTPMPCGPSHGLGYAASDQCMPQVCVEITTGNMKGHCHNVLCPDCGSGVIRGPGVTKFHLRDNSCGNNDPNAQFYDPVHKLYHTFFQDHLGIPQYQNPRNRSDPSDTGSWSGGVVYGHMVSRGTLFPCEGILHFHTVKCYASSLCTTLAVLAVVLALRTDYRSGAWYWYRTARTDFAHWAHLPVALWNVGSFKPGGGWTGDKSNSGGIFTGSTTMINGGAKAVLVLIDLLSGVKTIHLPRQARDKRRNTEKDRPSAQGVTRS